MPTSRRLKALPSLELRPLTLLDPRTYQMIPLGSHPRQTARYHLKEALTTISLRFLAYGHARLPGNLQPFEVPFSQDRSLSLRLLNDIDGKLRLDAVDQGSGWHVIQLLSTEAFIESEHNDLRHKVLGQCQIGRFL